MSTYCIVLLKTHFYVMFIQNNITLIRLSQLNIRYNPARKQHPHHYHQVQHHHDHIEFIRDAVFSLSLLSHTLFIALHSLLYASFLLDSIFFLKQHFVNTPIGGMHHYMHQRWCNTQICVYD